MFNIFKFIFFLGFFHLTTSLDKPDKGQLETKNEKFKKCCEENGVKTFIASCNYNNLFDEIDDSHCKNTQRNGGNVNKHEPEQAKAKFLADEELDLDTLFDKEMIAFQKCYANSKDVSGCCQDNGVIGESCLQFCKPSDTMTVGDLQTCLCDTKIIATCVYNSAYND